MAEMNRAIYQHKLDKENLEDEIQSIRKRFNDQQKKIGNSEDTIDKLEQHIDDLRRKESKAKREVEEKEDANAQLRNEMNKLNEELATIKAQNTQQTLEIKRILNDLSHMEQSVERKDNEVANLRKELQNERQKLREREEERMEKRGSLKREVQRLEEEVLKKEKTIIELESQLQHERNRLDSLQHQNQRHLSSTSESYSAKLKLYIEEITSIKKVLEDNNLELNGLRHQLKETGEENQQLAHHCSRLQSKCEEEVANSRQLHQSYQSLKEQDDGLREKFVNLEFEYLANKNSLKTLKNEMAAQERQLERTTQKT